MSNKQKILVGLGILLTLFLTVFIYWQGMNGPFVLDDRQNITEDYLPYFDWQAIFYTITHNTSGSLGRPVSVISLLFSGIVHGPVTWGYKYHNLLLHLMNGLVLFWVLLRLLPELDQRKSHEKIVLISGLTAVVWLLHPLMVSTVLYAVQRMAQLSSLFTLTAVLCYLVARKHSNGDSRLFYLAGYVGVPLSMAMAVLSKESGALIPIYLLLLEAVVFKWRRESAIQQNRLLTFYTIFCVLPLLGAVIYAWLAFDVLADYETRDFTMSDRLLTQLHVIMLYLKLILIPQVSEMSLFHDDIRVIRQLDITTFVIFISLIMTVILAVVIRKKHPVITLGIGWFLISHLMESTFINLEMVFEHRNYLAILGPLLIVVYYVINNKSLGRYIYFPVSFLGLLVILTWIRVQEWSYEEVFYTAAVTDHPESRRARVEYANMRFRDGFLQEAITHLDAAHEMDQKNYGALINQLVFLCDQSVDLEPIRLQAVDSAARNPVTPYALNSFDILIGRLNRNECDSITLPQLQEIVEAAISQPDNQAHSQFLGFLQRQQGQIYMLQGEYSQGLVAMSQAYENARELSILLELLEIQLEFGFAGDARIVINEIERRNAASFGSEESRLAPLRERLQIMLEDSGNNEEQEQVDVIP